MKNIKKISRNQLKFIIGSRFAASCVAICAGGGTVSVSCSGTCAAEDGVGAACSDGSQSSACPKVISAN